MFFVFFYGSSRCICLTWHLNRDHTHFCFQKRHRQVGLCSLSYHNILNGAFVEAHTSVVFRHASVVSETFPVFQETYRMEGQLMASPMEFTYQTAIFALLEIRCPQGSCPPYWLTVLSQSLTVERFEYTDVKSFLFGFSCTELPPHLEKIKQQANDAFARQQWTHAIQLYSLGIHQASCNAMLYGNRAAAYMKRKW